MAATFVFHLCEVEMQGSQMGWDPCLEARFHPFLTLFAHRIICSATKTASLLVLWKPGVPCTDASGLSTTKVRARQAHSGGDGRDLQVVVLVVETRTLGKLSCEGGCKQLAKRCIGMEYISPFDHCQEELAFKQTRTYPRLGLPCWERT